MNKPYIGFYKKKIENEEKEFTIREIMEEFMGYVLKSDDSYMPKEKIKVIISDYLGDNGINPLEWVKEDEQSMLEKWNKAVLDW